MSASRPRGGLAPSTVAGSSRSVPGSSGVHRADAQYVANLKQQMYLLEMESSILKQHGAASVASRMTSAGDSGPGSEFDALVGKLRSSWAEREENLLEALRVVKRDLSKHKQLNYSQNNLIGQLKRELQLLRGVKQQDDEAWRRKVTASVDEAARARRETERITAARDRLSAQIEELQRKTSEQTAANREELTHAQSENESLNIALGAAQQQVQASGEQRAAAEFAQQQAEQARSDMQDKLSQEQEQRQATAEELEATKGQLSRTVSELESTMAALEQAKRTAADASAAREAAFSQLHDAEDRIAQLDDEVQRAQDDAVAAQDAQLEAERRMGAAEDQQHSLERQLEGAFQALRDRDQRIAQQDALLRQGGEHSAELQQDLGTASEALANTKQKHDATRAELVATAAALTGAQTREGDAASRLDAMSLRLADAEGTISALRAELQTVTSQRDRSLALLRAVNVPGVVQANMDVAATVQQALNSMLGSREGEAGGGGHEWAPRQQASPRNSDSFDLGSAHSAPRSPQGSHGSPPGGDSQRSSAAVERVSAAAPQPPTSASSAAAMSELRVSGAALTGIGSRTEATASSLHLSQWK